MNKIKPQFYSIYFNVAMFLITLLLFASNVSAAVPSYTAVTLGSLNGTYSQAYDVNSAGWAVGYSASNTTSRQAVLWKNGQIIDLGSLGGEKSIALSVNNSGQVVGVSHVADSSTHVFLWENGVMTDISTADILFGPGSGTISLNMEPGLNSNSSQNMSQVAINDAGQVVMRGSRTFSCSNSYNGTCWERFAVIYQNGEVTRIPGDFGEVGFSDHLSINNAGVVAASSYLNGYMGLTYNSYTGEFTILPNFGSCPSWVYINVPAAINDVGDVVGAACVQLSTSPINTKNHGYLWKRDAASLVDLGLLGSNPENEAFPRSINNSGQIVGNAIDRISGTGTFSKAFYYDNQNGMVNLNDIVENVYSGSNPSGIV